MAGTEQRCKNCQHATWQFGPKGGIKRNAYGTCTVEFTMPPLPSCITYTRPHRTHIWQDDGYNCPVWEEKTA